MDKGQDLKAKNYLKGVMKKAQNAVKLVIGNSEVYSEEDSGGDLKFNPAIMMKINVTFDKEFLPKEKVVKLNVRGSRFFSDIKRNLRVINAIYIVYPSEYEIQFDVRREEWEKRLINELNGEYQLNLEKIHFVNEEEICRIYQRKGISTIRKPYNLETGELLIIAGGFINFNMEKPSLAEVKVNLKKESEAKSGKVEKQPYQGEYFDKYDPRAGAYFFVGGEWFHNIFVPELFQKEEPRFFSFRIADDGKDLKFFSDLKMRGIDILADVKPQPAQDYEEVVYTINPAYLSISRIIDFKLSTIIYDTREEIEEEEEEIVSPDVPAEPPGIPEMGVPEMEEEEKPEMEIKRLPQLIEDEPEEETLPCLENEMVLLPMPTDQDISSYIMSVGEEKKCIKFYTSSTDDEVSILAPERDENIYKRKIDDSVDYSIKLDSIGYSISNTLLSQVEDKELRLYFAWELKSTDKEQIPLKADFYVFGREPLDNLEREFPDHTYEQLVRLNKGNEDFWRIGASRDHALLLKTEKGHTLYNISLSYPVYILKAAEINNPIIHPSRLESVGEEKQEKLAQLLSRIKGELVSGRPGLPDASQWVEELNACANSIILAHDDLVIIGNKVFKYIVPLVTESILSDRVQKSILRKIQINKSILRK